jgi:hypothetical protein
VTAGEQTYEQSLEHCVLSDDDPLDFVERFLECLARFRARILGLIVIAHLSSHRLFV